MTELVNRCLGLLKLCVPWCLPAFPSSTLEGRTDGSAGDGKARRDRAGGSITGIACREARWPQVLDLMGDGVVPRAVRRRSWWRIQTFVPRSDKTGTEPAASFPALKASTNLIKTGIAPQTPSSGATAPSSTREAPKGCQYHAPDVVIMRD